MKLGSTAGDTTRPATGVAVIVHSGLAGRRRYPGTVERVTAQQVVVVYDASSTGGRSAICEKFWKKDGTMVGYAAGPRITIDTQEQPK